MRNDLITENSILTRDISEELPLIAEESPSKPSTSRTTPSKTRNSFYYLTDIKGFLSISASGLILPAAADDRLMSLFNKKCSSRLPIWRGILPSCLLASGDQSDRLRQPVLIEFKSSLLNGSSIPAITRDGGNSTGSFGRTKKDVLCLLPAGAIPISAAMGVYMASEEEASDLKLRLETFSNTCLPNLQYASFEDFETDTEVTQETIMNTLEKVPICEALKQRDYFQRLDGIRGLMIWIVNAIPNEREWFGAVSELFQGMSSKKNGKLKRPNEVWDYLGVLPRVVLQPDVISESSMQSLEMAILHSSTRILAEVDASDGLELEMFISSVVDYVERCSLSEGDLKRLHTWRDYCESLVRGESSPRRLADDSESNVRRGLALFLMRPNLDRLQQVHNSSLNPGPTVFFIASCLAALQEGFAKMDGEVKQNQVIRDFSLNASARQCNVRGGDKFESISEESVKVRTDEVEHERITKLLTIMVDAHIIASTSIGPNDAMRGLYSRARSHRYNLEYDFEKDCFSYLVNFEEDRTQKVYISVYESEMEHEKELIRFASPCLDLSGRKKLTAQQLEYLLLTNASPDIHCRFALDSDAKHVVVIADQLLETNDWEEFEYFCAEVARVADDYERSHDIDVY